METTKKTRKTSELLKIKQIIKLCEKNNISRIRYENVEIEFGEKKVRQSNVKLEKYQNDESKYTDSPNVDMPPDDVMLFAATPHFDSIIEDRKKSKKDK